MIVVGVALLLIGGRCAERQSIDVALWRATPTAVTPDALANADPDTMVRKLIVVEIRSPQDVGRLVRENDEGRVTRTDAGFFLVDIGDRKSLLMSARRQLPADTTIHAVVFRVSAEQRRVLLDPLTRDDAALRGALLPYSLTLSRATFPLPWRFFVALATVLAGAWLVLRAIGQKMNHRRHPIFAKLARYGDAAAVEAEIERELAEGRNAFKHIALLSNYVVLYDATPEVLRYDDVVWIYGEVTEKHGRFDKGKICIETADDTAAKAGMESQAELMQALSLLAARAPWALVGHSEENKERMGFARRAATVAEILKTRDHNLGRG